MSLDRTITHAIARLRASLSPSGRLSVAQPWMLAFGPLLLVGAVIAPYRWLFYSGYVFLLLCLGCYAWVRYIGPRVQLQRHHRDDWAQVGDTLIEEWTLTNKAALPLIWLEIDDASTLPGYNARRVAFAGSQDSQHWQTTARCMQRGLYSFGPFDARMTDPLGIFCYEWRDPAARQIVIYPPLVRLPLLVPHGQRGGLARADLLQQHVTPSVGGLREYVPGDPPSRIHWPTVARRGELMVKQFDQEQAGALWIAVDLCAASYADDTPPITDAAQTASSESAIYAARAVVNSSSAVARAGNMYQATSALELAIVLACSLAAQALSEGRAVGLLAHDERQRTLAPARGQRQLWQILSALVDAQSSGALPLGDMLRYGTASQGQGGNTAIAAITPDLSGAWLPALIGTQRGRPGGALALLVGGAADAAALAARLAQAGVGTQSFAVTAPLPLLNPRSDQPEARVSPLGRVVRQ